MQITFNDVAGNEEVYMDCLRSICGVTEGKSMVDLGCCFAPHTCQLGFEKRTYIDINDRQLDDKNEQANFICTDILEWLPKQERYDVSISSDLIEHLTDEDGVYLLKQMQIKSDKMVLFTPLGFYMVDKNDTNPENHHSGWTPEILESVMPNFFSYIIFPVYHPTLNIGAFFFWWTKDMKQDFERVEKELKNKTWAKN